MVDYNDENLRTNCRSRVLEMFKKVESIDSSRKVLVMDDFTIKTLSYSFKFSEVLEQQVCVQCKLNHIRQPLRSLSAIYFIQPTKESVNVFLRDMARSPPFYRKAFLFFSSLLPEELKTYIMSHATLKGRMRMWELNLEYLVIDSLCFITNNELALGELFENEEHKGVACLDEMAARIATVFVSLQEYPVVRYQAAKTLTANTVTPFRDLIPTKLAAMVIDRLMKYKETNPKFFPQRETCELLILDRSIDQISPVIHEWTYEAMRHDLLSLPNKPEHGFSEDDSLWLELRHTHIADVYEKLHEKVNNCAHSLPAQFESGSRYLRGDVEQPVSKLAKLARLVPSYNEQKEQLDIHIENAFALNEIVNKFGLRELGQLEQDLVVGDAGTKDAIKYLCLKDNTTREHKLRLLMILASIYPEDFEGEKGYKLMKMAALEYGDMNAIHNVRLLGGISNIPKSSMATLFSKFGMHEKKRAARKKKATKEEAWKFSHFYPLIEELVEKLSKGELSKEDYPCINGSGQMSAEIVSRRTRESPTWARPQLNGNRFSRYAKGPRIFVFIAGGATRAELRVCHKLTTKLKRQIVLGSSSLDDPVAFITKMRLLKMSEDGCFESDLLT